jgi:hypothetical protein
MKPVGIYLAVKLNKIPGRIAYTLKGVRRYIEPKYAIVCSLTCASEVNRESWTYKIEILG